MKNNYKRDRTVCKICYNKKKRKNEYSTLIQQSKIDIFNNKISIPEKRKNAINYNASTYENDRHVVFGPSNVGKTYYTMEIFKSMGNKRRLLI